ncbi:MAG TPA: hypothetical protein VI757_11755 [Bacteroidia bacterium]|nr:hypothetical protein [Bacteroidia bacterium]
MTANNFKKVLKENNIKALVRTVSKRHFNAGHLFVEMNCETKSEEILLSFLKTHFGAVQRCSPGAFSVDPKKYR